MPFKKMLATGAALAIAAASSITTAEAGHRHHNGFPFAAGAFGFAAGALIASALAPRYPYYYNGYDPYYYEDPYYAPRAYYAPGPRAYYAPTPRVYDRDPGYDICDTPGSKPAWAMC